MEQNPNPARCELNLNPKVKRCKKQNRNIKEPELNTNRKCWVPSLLLLRLLFRIRLRFDCRSTEIRLRLDYSATFVTTVGTAAKTSCAACIEAATQCHRPVQVVTLGGDI